MSVEDLNVTPNVFIPLKGFIHTGDHLMFRKSNGDWFLVDHHEGFDSKYLKDEPFYKEHLENMERIYQEYKDPKEETLEGIVKEFIEKYNIQDFLDIWNGGDKPPSTVACVDLVEKLCDVVGYKDSTKES